MTDPVCPRCGRKLTRCTTTPPTYVCSCYGSGCCGVMSELEYEKAKYEILRKDFVNHLKAHNKFTEAVKTFIE
jgi:hypothetical protein